MSSSGLLQWLTERRLSNHLECKEILFAESGEWSFENGALVHQTGGFFSIEGVKARWALDGDTTLYQPVINQPEIGILGFLVKETEEGPKWLLQAKNEPGNVFHTQIGPSVQATYSNYMRLHGGAATHYLDYFTSPDSQFAVDCLQSEQGTRFLGKFNRNVVCYVEGDEKEVNEFYRWVPCRELQRALLEDYIINTDSRSVLVSAPWSLFLTETGKRETENDKQYAFSLALSASYQAEARAGLQTQVVYYLESLRDKAALELELVGLDQLPGWARSNSVLETTDRAGALEVRQFVINAPEREKTRWDQPLVKSLDRDLVCLLCQQRGDELRFLLRPAYEIGLTGGVELGPSYKAESGRYFPSWLSDLIACSSVHSIAEVEQSDEGGRFMVSKCQYRIVQLGADIDVPKDTDNWWFTASELEVLCRSGKLLTNEARSVISMLLAFL